MIFRDGQKISETAAAPGETDEAAVVAHIVEAGFTGRARVVVETGVDSDAIADFVFCNGGADGGDCAGEFVAEDDGDCFVGYGMGACRAEIRTTNVFVEVWKIVMRVFGVGDRSERTYQFHRFLRMQALL